MPDRVSRELCCTALKNSSTGTLVDGDQAAQRDGVGLLPALTSRGAVDRYRRRHPDVEGCARPGRVDLDIATHLLYLGQDDVHSTPRPEIWLTELAVENPLWNIRRSASASGKRLDVDVETLADRGLAQLVGDLSRGRRRRAL